MPRVSAAQVYSILSQHSLTTEQTLAVEGASAESPTLVIAGAGSGKTELMTVRILYLVANNLALPEQILGLTFTRKAASELSARVNQALFKLRESQFWPADLAKDFLPPNITTYNSFGNEIFRRLSLSLGYEADAQILTEASSVALVQDLLRHLPGELSSRLEDWEKSSDYLVELVLNLAAEITDNQTSPGSATKWLETMGNYVAALPKKDKSDGSRFAYTQDHLSSIALNQLLTDLTSHYLEQKRKRNLVDFSDQVGLALEALEKNELLLDYRFVMLDEYQDTSSIQTRLLSRLFFGMPVMAVGDPNQAIYGWRGASSANLENFLSDFGGGSNQLLNLSTSWRSGSNIVAAANLISQNLAENPSYLHGTPAVIPITLSPGNTGLQDTVETQVFTDEIAEKDSVTTWVAAAVTPTKTTAILFRTKASMASYAEALGELGIEVEVTGLSGLLGLPEVMDLISTLRVIESADSGSYLLRLLSGPKWRIGPKDLVELSNYAKKLSRIRDEVTRATPVTIVEALDELRRPNARQYIEVSDIAFERLTQAAKLFHLMRTKSSLGLAELSWAIVRELEIDIELYAHSLAKNPLAHIEAFISRISEYENSSIRPTLSSLMRWLDYAMDKESFELPKSGAKLGVVQLMSVHAAKGLEWDSVAVVGMSKGGFPLDLRESRGFLSPGKIPFALRGDAKSLPVLDYEIAQSQKEFNELFGVFQDQLRESHLREERRLSYVAITRAKSKLLLTASHFKEGAKKPREVSIFLQEILDSKISDNLGFADVPEQNPLDILGASKIWPFDPLGKNRESIKRAADQLQSTSPASSWDSDELALLMEEKERASFLASPDFPKRLSASQVGLLLADPSAFAQAILRPMPNLFQKTAQMGTDFHANLERALLAETEPAIEDFGDDQKELGANFLGSRFANLLPYLVEEQIEFVIGQTLVVCKLDAVFETEAGFEIVDWKSGTSPKDKTELSFRSIQLAIYRIALAKKLGIGIEQIRASFFFAGDGVEIAPDSLLSEAEIADGLEKAKTARRI